jgi:hypothetical protein
LGHKFSHRMQEVPILAIYLLGGVPYRMVFLVPRGSILDLWGEPVLTPPHMPCNYLILNAM